MRKSKFTETLIVGMIKEAESGVPVPEISRKHGVGQSTFYKWRSKYGGMEVKQHLEGGQSLSDTHRVALVGERNRWEDLYQSAITLNHFEGLNLTIAALKVSHLEQLNNEIFALPIWM
ncbi:hypothetical protein PA25_19010 [Pseudoalteromonas sp. A25]|nr:hypothetical protein PA25_19010 [Pseudoalteromonas sp. A25]